MKRIILLLLIVHIAISVKSQDILTARSQVVGDTVTISGIVTNGDELGPIRYVEDQTAGIALYDTTTNPSFNYLSNVLRGDSITITGGLADFNGLLEIYVTGFPVIHSNNNTLPTPQILTPNQIGESTESELVQFNNAIFTNGGSTFTSTTYDFSSSGQQGKIYLRSGSPLIGTLIPMGPVTLIGVSSQYTFAIPANDGYQILPRDSADIIFSGDFIFTSPVIQSNITTSSFDLSWTTSDTSLSFVNYGTTSSLGTISSNGASNSFSHTLNLSGLQPATIYYAECFSIHTDTNGIDTVSSGIGVYSTASNSSGKIRPYFNHTVDLSVSTGVDAQNISTYFNDTIKAYMDLAQSTLDICVYNASDATIATAINDAYNRGVQVRYIADDDGLNSMLSSLDPNIPIVYRDPNTAGIMHNKFIIVDANSTDNSWVMGGSCNWTNPSNLFNDYNNLIFIQDEALAKAYTLEFDEMWGGGPSTGGGVFGTHKTDNTPHKFLIDGKDVEVYFSPSDQTTSKIIDVINNVDYTFEFALLSFTKNDLGEAVIAKDAEFGVNIRGIMEQQNMQGSEYDALIDANVNVKSHMGVTHQLHHKYAIADANVQFSDPTVLTGSHNWSNNAENNSDENTIIIHDHTIANIYLQEFTERFNELSSGTNIDEFIDLEIDLYPNPSGGKVNVKTELQIAAIKLYDKQGKLLEITYEPELIIQKAGLYFIKIITEEGALVKKVIIY